MKIFITGASGFIGTNLVDLLISKGYDNIVNFDKAEPIRKEHVSYWRKGNMMNANEIESAVAESTPDIFIHLAARTDTLSHVLDDYDENITGTANVLTAIKQSSSIKRAIITSTQYVYKKENPEYPQSDTDFEPHTVYGQSKVLTEKFTREANLECVWTIIRPTNIWGPWHLRYPLELWKVIDKGMYFHPVKDPVIRTYGYVKNVALQIFEIMLADVNVINKKVFYVGDAPIDSYKWINEFSEQLTGKRVKRLPKVIFSTVAKVGDVLRKAKFPFPLYTERFKNMIESYPAPAQKTIDIFGVMEHDLKKNVAETVEWLKTDGKDYFEYWKNR